jgi:putative hydrolase of the HAD superfamily
MWSGALLEVLHKNGIGSHLTAEDFHPFLTAGFRWHIAHTKNRVGITAAEWWEELDPIFERAFREGAGVNGIEARRLAKEVRIAYLNPSQWSLFPDVQSTLTSLTAQGRRHVLLTNHVPELVTILQGLEIQHLFTAVFNSADTGIEKPHLEAFENVRSALPPGSELWMIGDNYTADVLGAEAAGIPAILARKPHSPAKRYVEDLTSLLDNFL